MNAISKHYIDWTRGTPDINEMLRLHFLKSMTICMFSQDLLDNNENDEERPQKKKRKLSNSLENNMNNQEIHFIKVGHLKSLFNY